MIWTQCCSWSNLCEFLHRLCSNVTLAEHWTWCISLYTVLSLTLLDFFIDCIQLGIWAPLVSDACLADLAATSNRKSRRKLKFLLTRRYRIVVFPAFFWVGRLASETRFNRCEDIGVYHQPQRGQDKNKIATPSLTMLSSPIQYSLLSISPN